MSCCSSWFFLDASRCIPLCITVIVCLSLENDNVISIVFTIHLLFCLTFLLFLILYHCTVLDNLYYGKSKPPKNKELAWAWRCLFLYGNLDHVLGPFCLCVLSLETNPVDFFHLSIRHSNYWIRWNKYFPPFLHLYWICSTFSCISALFYKLLFPG